MVAAARTLESFAGIVGADHVREALAGRSDFLSGRCVGAVEDLDDLGSGIKLFCPPEITNNLDRVRVIVAYIETQPERMKDGFGLMASEAMAKAWPCK